MSALVRTVRDLTGYDVEYVDAAGVTLRVGLGSAWSVRFESVAPVRGFPVYKGQSNFTGLRWSATTGRHVPYESWLERDNAMLLDFDPKVVGYASQPFRLFWEADGIVLGHTPDYFARLADGSGLVVDVRADDRIDERAARAFDATKAACQVVGWEFRRVGVLDPMFAANVRWLAGYRYPRCSQPEVEARLRSVFGQPTPLFAGAEQAGLRVAVLPVVYHLMWHRQLVADLRTAPLGAGTVVRCAKVGEA